MNIYEIVIQINNGSRPDQNIEAKRYIAATSQMAVDKMRDECDSIFGFGNYEICAVNQIINCKDWK